MKAMLLAAGRGERLRPITDTLPKPLLQVAGRTLIEHQLIRLADAGFKEVVINVNHLAELIQARLGNGAAYGLSIEYSVETVPLETGGGVKRALPLLGEAPVAVISADTFNDYDYSLLPDSLPENCLGYLVMVNNPAHHPTGDFSLRRDGVLGKVGEKLTWSSVSVLSPELVRHESEEIFMLRKVFDEAIEAGRLQGVLHEGYWCDVGTVERYEELQKHLSTRQGGQ